MKTNSFGLLLAVCLLFSSFLPAQPDWTATAELDINNVSATIRIGDLWFTGSDGAYIVPKDDSLPKTSLFAGALWMGGYTEDGELRTAISTYEGNVFPNYWAGPLDPETGTTTDETMLNWDRMFPIRSFEVILHLADYEQDGDIDSSVPENIRGWPGRGNPEFFDIHGFELPDQDLAPFGDRNGNGIYEPLQGDYPLMKGDQAYWWVFNDAGGEPSFSSETIGMEVQAMAFAFNTTDTVRSNTTFYDFKLNYYGSEPLDSFSTSLWVDPNLGCYADDYIGCSPDHDLFYVYNADDFDQYCGEEGYGEDIPVLGIRMLRGMEDEAGTGPGFTSFMFYINSANDGPYYFYEPNNPEQAFNYMNAYWRDGFPLTFGGDGRGGLEQYSYVFDGSPLNDSTNWRLCEIDIAQYERRVLFNSGPILINPGDSRYMSYAVIWSKSVEYPCPDLSNFFAETDVIRDFYESLGDGISSDVASPAAEVHFADIFPNPADDRVFIQSDRSPLHHLRVFDAAGKEVLQIEVAHTQTVELHVSDWADGLYFYELTSKQGLRQTGKLVVY